MDQLTSQSTRETVAAPTDTEVNMRTWVFVAELTFAFVLVGQILSGFFAGIAFLTFGWWAY
jgi:hypothetical protein